MNINLCLCDKNLCVEALYIYIKKSGGCVLHKLQANLNENTNAFVSVCYMNTPEKMLCN